MEKYYSVVVFDKLDLPDNITKEEIEERHLKDIDGFYRTHFGDIWSCAIYPNAEDAIETVEKNITDIREDCYEYALVEEYAYGLYPHLLSCKLYKWDYEQKKFVPHHHCMLDKWFQGFTFFH